MVYGIYNELVTYYRAFVNQLISLGALTFVRIRWVDLIKNFPMGFWFEKGIKNGKISL